VEALESLVERVRMPWSYQSPAFALEGAASMRPPCERRLPSRLGPRRISRRHVSREPYWQRAISTLAHARRRVSPRDLAFVQRYVHRAARRNRQGVLRGVTAALGIMALHDKSMTQTDQPPPPQ